MLYLLRHQTGALLPFGLHKGYGLSVLIELSFLPGRDRLPDREVQALLTV